ncbi:MAG TPA: hypothetical protein VLN59_14970 [Burkholderiales bacterium]|nr:hypothetical protein [Burkholderiales bacterium]
MSRVASLLKDGCMNRSSTRWYALILVALLTACGSGSTGVPPETTSIAAVADNQVGFEALNATRTTHPSSANLAQLQREGCKGCAKATKGIQHVQHHALPVFLDRFGTSSRRISIAHRLEPPMNHSKMLSTRRRKQKGKKLSARLAKHEKKVSKQNAKRVSSAA